MANKTAYSLKMEIESNLWSIISPLANITKDAVMYSSIASKVECAKDWNRWCETAVLIADEVLKEKG